jgi:hypothetical protein
MSQVFSNGVKVHVTTFDVESQLYKRMVYDVKDRLTAIITTDDHDEFISFRYLPILNLPSLKDCIENKKMSISTVAEEFGCADTYVSSIMGSNGIVPNITKEKQMIVARGRGAM